MNSYGLCVCVRARAPERARERACVTSSQALGPGNRSRAEEGMGVVGGEGDSCLLFELRIQFKNWVTEQNEKKT